MNLRVGQEVVLIAMQGKGKEREQLVFDALGAFAVASGNGDDLSPPRFGVRGARNSNFTNSTGSHSSNRKPAGRRGSGSSEGAKPSDRCQLLLPVDDNLFLPVRSVAEAATHYRPVDVTTGCSVFCSSLFFSHGSRSRSRTRRSPSRAGIPRSR